MEQSQTLLGTEDGRGVKSVVLMCSSRPFGTSFSSTSFNTLNSVLPLRVESIGEGCMRCGMDADVEGLGMKRW